MALNPSLSPAAVLAQVAQALPASCRDDVIIIGSLAAGYYFFADDGAKAVRTKDVDCMFSPHAKAVAVMGSFDDWSPEGVALARDDDGAADTWSAEREVDAARR